MTVTFISACLEAAMTCFYEQFSKESAQQGFEVYQRASPTRARYAFATDDLVREVRMWGSGALTCGLVVGFTCTMET